MRYLIALCLLLAVSRPAAAQFRALASVDRINGKLAGRVVDYTNNHGEDRRIVSRVLGQPRDMYVYLPPGYDPRKSYPLLLYFHIARVDEHEFLGSGRLIELDRMIQAGAFPPTVVVCPDGTISGRNHIRSRPSFYINGVNGRFEDFILGEVIPFVTSRYSIRPEREAHAILGLSSGGFGALSIAMRHRDYFGSVATLAAPANLLYSDCHGDILEDFHPETSRWRTEYNPNQVVGRFYGGLLKTRASYYLEPVFGRSAEEVNARMRAVNPANLIDQTDLQQGELAIYLHYAGSDGYNFDAHNESFAWLAALKGIPVTIQSDPPANHNLRYFRRNHRPAFNWLAEHLPSPTCAR